MCPGAWAKDYQSDFRSSATPRFFTSDKPGVWKTVMILWPFSEWMAFFFRLKAGGPKSHSSIMRRYTSRASSPQRMSIDHTPIFENPKGQNSNEAAQTGTTAGRPRVMDSSAAEIQLRCGRRSSLRAIARDHDGNWTRLNRTYSYGAKSIPSVPKLVSQPIFILTKPKLPLND